jgi:hypothetical protein
VSVYVSDIESLIVICVSQCCGNTAAENLKWGLEFPGCRTGEGHHALPSPPLFHTKCEKRDGDTKPKPYLIMPPFQGIWTFDMKQTI